MKHGITRRIWTLLLLLVGLLPARAELKHRYSFSDAPGAATVKDSAGTADGKLSGGATLGGGSVALDGNDGYVDLPNGIISTLTNATFEAWVTWSGEGGAWQRVFDFGNNSNGEDQQGTGQTYLFLTPRTGTDGPIRFAATSDPAATPRENPILDAPTMAAGVPVHVVVTYDADRNVSRLFVDGKLISTGTVTVQLKDIVDINNWLGRSNWPDAFFQGSFDEFRIYDEAITPLRVALDKLAGPGQVGGGDAGALQTVGLTTSATLIKGDTEQAAVSATFANVSDVDVSLEAETTYISSAPSVLTVSSNGLLKAVKTGTAAITATFRGKQDTKTITVAPLPSLTPRLKHRYSFNGAPGETQVVDSVSGANANIMAGAGLTGEGNVDLDGAGGYVDLPNGIISSLTNATFEAWVTWGGGSAWQRLFDFGTNTGGEDKPGNGTTYLFLSPNNGANGRIRYALTLGAGESPVLDAPTAMAIGKQTHVVVSYNVTERSSRLYVNGKLVASGTAGNQLRGIKDLNNWLGRSNFSADPYFQGKINEFRIYEGVLSDQEVSYSGAAGPDVLGRDPGTLNSLSVAATSDTLVLGGLPASASILGTFQNIANVNLSGFEGAKFESLTPTVLNVSTNGEVEAVGVGTGTIKGSYVGKQATMTFTVTAPTDNPPKSTLAHRYSFSDAAGGAKVKDSVGTADGTLMGGGTFNGTQLKLNGTSGYVDLPNGTISALKNATFETWVTWSSASTWQRIFDIGSNSGGEDASGTGQTYLFLSPRGGANVIRFTITENSGAGESPVLESTAALTVNKETHLAVVYNLSAGAARLYVNGKRVAVGAATVPLGNIEDVNVWLGRSNYNDPYFNGSFNEFRIYDGALLDAEVAADFAAGPDTLPSEVVQAPTLAAARVAGNLVLTWPGTAAGFTLESSAALGSAAGWTAVGTAPVTDNGNFKVTIPSPGQTVFYRLKK